MNSLSASDTKDRSLWIEGRDLHHSRPLDVHRISEHPEAKALIDQVWDRWFAEKFPKKSGKQAKASFKKQFSVLFLDLFVAWKDDPELSIGVGMKLTDFKQDSRYNRLFISDLIRHVIHHAHDQGLIGLWSGKEALKRRTRIWPLEPLIELFEAARFGVLDIGRDQECIILSPDKRDLEKGKRTPPCLTMTLPKSSTCGPG